MVLPILPALAASSPIMEGKVADKLDKRLDVYRNNQKRFPVITGDVIPEAIASQQEYEERILRPIYEAIRPHDPDSILQYEWLNSRGAIARFDRNAIEIRVLDIQECPAADVAIAGAVVNILKNMIYEKWAPFVRWSSFPSKLLSEIFFRCGESGEEAMIDNYDYLRIFQLDRPLKARDLWRYLLTDMIASDENEALEVILREGPLARRILRSYNADPSHFHMRELYEKLSCCLARGELFQW
jgi:carboxylate-amine ligase